MQFKDLYRQYQNIKESIDNSIQSIINSSDFISGEPVKLLEQKLSSYVGVRHCITCANGTDAITISLRAILNNILQKDWKNCAVFVPDFTFFSSGECPAGLGLPVYFVDVRCDTFNIDARSLEVAVEKVIQEGKHKPKIVIAVDLFGQPAEYRSIRAICDKYGMFLLEDSAQGLGGYIIESGHKNMAGSLADIATTSFFPAKPLGCYGDGGAIFTDNDEWADLCRSIAIHGKNADDKYDNIRLGYNSRLDTIQAAVLNAKFDVFRDFELDAVNNVADWYNEILGSTNLILPKVLENYRSSWAQYTVKLPCSIERGIVQERLGRNNIPTMIYYKKPMHKQGAFKNTLSEKADCPVTEQLCETVLCLPIHPYLEYRELEIICKELQAAL